jgi:hypothetical protein
MIEATYTLEEPEYLEAHAMLLHSVRKGSSRRIWLRIGLWLAVILVLTLCYALLNPGFSIREFVNVRLSGILLFFILSLAFLPWRMKRAAKKQYAKTIRSTFTNFHLKIDGEGYNGESPGISSGHVNWKGFSSWKEGKTVFVLFRNNMMYPIPKRPFSGAELDELRDLLVSNIASQPQVG